MGVTRLTLEALDQEINRAGEIPERFFGRLDGARREKEKRLSALFRQHARACYPDLAEENDRALATDVTQRLNQMYAWAKRKVEEGAYGDHRPVAPPYRATTLIVGGEEIRLIGLLGEGLYSRVHTATAPGGPDGCLFVKVANLPEDNDLLEREFEVLRALHEPVADPMLEANFFAVQRRYVPMPLRTWMVPGSGGGRHRAGLYRTPEDRCFTGQELRERKFPDGIEPRHVWWIFRRLLLTLWMAHLHGYAHGAVTPDHLLIYPEAHGLVLLDWTHASRISTEYVPAIDPAFDAWYPPEVKRKETVTPATDLFMAASTAIYLLGGDIEDRWIPGTVTAPLRQALLSCLEPDPGERPQDAETYHNQMGALLGPRRYADFIVP